MIQFRAMVQDFMALSKLYYIADSCKFDVRFEDGPDELRVMFDQIADSFANACTALQSDLTEKRLNIGSGPAAYTSAMKAAVRRLGVHEQRIYKTWCETPFLRSCELRVGSGSREFEPTYIP